MVDRSSAEAERASAHREHVRWLQQQQAELTEHRSRTASMREEEDFAVGSDVVGFGPSSPTYSMSDEMNDVHYRSLDMPSLAADSASIEVEALEETLVYRSLPSLMREPSESSGSDAIAEADASWLAAGRPPMLSRQRAFNRPENDMHDMAWVGPRLM